MTGQASIQIDIISDVMCPWCIVGYAQLATAMRQTGATARLRWLPFQLNPDMPLEGELLTDHMMRKYGVSKSESEANRDGLLALGHDLGITFTFDDSSRIWNSFTAHQLLEFAGTEGKQHALKLAMFEAHFTHGRNMGDRAVLLELAEGVGLARGSAEAALTSGAYAQSVRDAQALWQSEGVSGVPTMIFAQKYVLTGAQGVARYDQVIRHVLKAVA